MLNDYALVPATEDNSGGQTFELGLFEPEEWAAMSYGLSAAAEAAGLEYTVVDVDGTLVQPTPDIRNVLLAWVGSADGAPYPYRLLIS
jgi:hypothetical protein